MSDEESNNSNAEENEEEENENEEDENEEDENEEGEEGEEEENEEGEEGEEEENEEEEDEDEKDTKKKKKNGNEASMFEENKLVEANEIKIDLPTSSNNDTFTIANIPISKPVNIFTLLSEINTDMDRLSSHWNATLPITRPITPKYIDKENDDMKHLLDRAKEWTREIENMEEKESIKNSEDKCIQSDDEDYYNPHRPPHAIDTSVHNAQHSPPHNYYSQPQQSNNYYDPDRNKNYYSSLEKNNANPMNFHRQNMNYNNRNMNNNMYNQGNPMDNNSNRWARNRTRVMDDLYRGHPGNQGPVIYSQPDVNSSQTMRESYPNKYAEDWNNSMTRKRQNNFNNYNGNNNYYSGNENNPNQNYNNSNRPFERVQPNNISDAMNILLDKQY